MDLKQLENDIIKYSKAYYDGNALISDAEFDDLLDNLKKLDPNNHLLTDIGHGYYQTDNNTVTHKFIIKRGLNKKFVDPDFKLPTGYLTPKYDGLSITLYYENGVFAQAVTRGDGTTGTDVTEKLKFHVPKNIDSRIKVITGEWLLSNENLKKYYPDSNSPRNIAGGALMKLTVDRKELSRFHFVAYRINKMETTSIKRDEMLTVLRKNGFLTPDARIYKKGVDFTSLFNFYKTYKHKGFTFMYDGLVYDSGTEVDNEEVIYKDEIAYKIVSETADVTVTEIKWNHTNTNRYVPVIYFNPVQLSGASITKCTGHNAKCIVDNEITVGTKIKINRSGEVIPKLIGVYTKNGYVGVAKS